MGNVGTGSPIFARQNPYVYLILLIAAIVIAIFALIFLAIKAIKKLQASPMWQEANRKRPCSYGHVKKLSKQMQLTIEDENLLWDICKRQKASNVLYLAKDMEQMDRLFCLHFKYMRSNGKNENAIYAIFALRAKFQAVCSVVTRLKTTFALKVGQIICINNSSTMKQPLEIAVNEKNGLFLLLPPNMQDQGSRPVELSKLLFSISTQTGGLYTFFSRVVRYTTLKDGRPVMLISHTNDIDYQERRKQKRIDIDQLCDFSAVKVTKTGNLVSYIPQETRYSAKIKDISAGGCKIATNMPIKEGQHLHIKFLLFQEDHEVVGVILRTVKGTQEGTYYLAIKFVQITQKVQNDILARVYDYF